MAYPLLCWDIVQEGISRRKSFAEDIDRLNKLAKQNVWDFVPGRTLDNCLVWENKTIIITDPALHIVFAAKNIYEMNGYTPGEVIGKTPKMFQGKATTEDEKRAIRFSSKRLRPFSSVVTNYRKDKSIYKCFIEGYPIFNKQKQLVNFIALENTVV